MVRTKRLLRQAEKAESKMPFHTGMPPGKHGGSLDWLQLELTSEAMFDDSDILPNSKKIDTSKLFTIRWLRTSAAC